MRRCGGSCHCSPRTRGVANSELVLVDPRGASETLGVDLDAPNRPNAKTRTFVAVCPRTGRALTRRPREASVWQSIT